MTRLPTALLFCCLAAFAAHAAALDLDGASWAIVDQTNCPDNPETVSVNAVPAWRIEIDETCAPRAVLQEANDALRAAIKDGAAALAVKLHVANGRLSSGEDGAYATVMLQGKDGDRQFASRNRIKLVNGTHTVAIPFDRTMWTDASGKSASGAAWDDLLANLDMIGIALGSERAEDQGVAGSGGLFMIEFKVE